MLIGHVPAGYLVTKLFITKMPSEMVTRIGSGKLLFVGMLSSVMLDLDLLYFYTLDGRQHSHHSYWTHIPIYWFCMLLILVVLTTALRKAILTAYAAIVSINVFVHLLLDTVVGKIMWLYPLSTHNFALFPIPFIYNRWVYNFIFHWTFLFELALVMAAVYCIVKPKISVNIKKLEWC
jgi:inner membrane protein